MPEAGDLPAAQGILIVPGELNTTLHPSGLGQTQLQDKYNCTTERRVFELDSRVRQFAPSPAIYAGPSCTNSNPTTVCVQLHDTLTVSCRPWDGGGTVTPCTSGWGIVGPSGTVCPFDPEPSGA